MIAGVRTDGDERVRDGVDRGPVQLQQARARTAVNRHRRTIGEVDGPEAERARRGAVDADGAGRGAVLQGKTGDVRRRPATRGGGRTRVGRTRRAVPTRRGKPRTRRRRIPRIGVLGRGRAGNEGEQGPDRRGEKQPFHRKPEMESSGN